MHASQIFKRYPEVRVIRAVDAHGHKEHLQFVALESCVWDALHQWDCPLKEKGEGVTIREKCSIKLHHMQGRGGDVEP